MTALFSEMPIEEIPDARDRQSATRFVFSDFLHVKMTTRPNYLIKGLLPRRGLALIWGPPKCGKSFFTFDLVMHVAIGRDYRGHRVQHGAVAYLALEGGGGFPARVEAWRQKTLDGADPASTRFYLLQDTAVDLIKDHRELIAAMGAQLPESPAIVVIDTLARALRGDENAPRDMGQLIAAADSITSAFNCLVVLVHHSGWAGAHARGHSSLPGADDVQIAVDKDADGLITVTVDHMKDSEVAPPFSARLETVRLGVDDDGDAITSCIVVPAAHGGARSKTARLTALQRRFMDVLREAIAEAAAMPLETGGQVPNGVPAVARDMLKKYCISRGWFDEDDSASNQRRKLWEMINRLAGERFIGASKHFVWIVP